MRPLSEIRAWADEHKHEADCDIAECVLASQWLRDIEASIHARWHRALEDPSIEPPGPIRDHIEQALSARSDREGSHR